MKITSKPSDHPNGHYYIFDGPIRYSRHFSPTIGLLAASALCDSRKRLYSTWKMHLKGVPIFFGDAVQPWCRTYKAAQTIFQGPTSGAVRASIHAAHRMLYARSTRNGFGLVESREDVFDLLRGGAGERIASGGSSGVGGNVSPHRVKPAVYTYIVAVHDDSLRFSETGAAFFVDFASKHALHANCAESVRYSGEFHPRPAVPGGWAGFHDDIADDAVEWELVVDNNSGTYAPDPSLLPALKALLEYNFVGIKVVALDFKDDELKQSREACRAYALAHRGVNQQELQPHAVDGEETLHQAAVNSPVEQSAEQRAIEDQHL